MDHTSPPAVIGGPCAPLEVCHSDAERARLDRLARPLPQGT